MNDIIFEVVDKSGRKIRLTKKQWKHIQKHPHMHESLERIEETIKNPATIRYDEFNEKVNYLNGEGFIITSFYTNKITGLKWKT